MDEIPILIHSEGSIVYCASGHEICELNRDIYRGDIGYSSALTNWRFDQKPAKTGDNLPLLCACGSKYFPFGSGRFKTEK
jgi:hypothetical protein